MGTVSPAVPLTRTETGSFMHAWARFILHLSTNSFSPYTSGKKQKAWGYGWEEDSYCERGRKEGVQELIYSFLLVYSSHFFPLFVFVGPPYQIPASFKASVRGRSQTPPSLSLFFSSSFSFLSSPTSNLNFRVSRRASRRFWSREEKQGGEGLGGEGEPRH